MAAPIVTFWVVALGTRTVAAFTEQAAAEAYCAWLNGPGLPGRDYRIEEVLGNPPVEPTGAFYAMMAEYPIGKPWPRTWWDHTLPATEIVHHSVTPGSRQRPEVLVSAPSRERARHLALEKWEEFIRRPVTPTPAQPWIPPPIQL